MPHIDEGENEGCALELTEHAVVQTHPGDVNVSVREENYES